MTDDQEERIARLEAKDEIRQLAYRYALALDARDFDAWESLFVPDCEFHSVFGKEPIRGREPMRRAISKTFRGFGATVHFVGNHVVDLQDEIAAEGATATGVVYCRAEHELSDSYVIQSMQYWDRYERHEGAWRFVVRRLRVWYAVDVLERPVGPDSIRWPGSPARRRTLPEAWPTFEPFAKGGA